VDGTAGSVPVSVLAAWPIGVTTTLYVPAATTIPEAAVNAAAVGFTSTSTGTMEAARVVDFRVTCEAAVPS